MIGSVIEKKVSNLDIKSYIPSMSSKGIYNIDVWQFQLIQISLKLVQL